MKHQGLQLILLTGYYRYNVLIFSLLLLYASEYTLHKQQKHNGRRSGKQLTMKEIKAFIGMIFNIQPFINL